MGYRRNELGFSQKSYPISSRMAVFLKGVGELSQVGGRLQLLSL